MRVSRVCGVLSIVFFLVAIVTIVLPIFSVGSGLFSAAEGELRSESMNGAGGSSTLSSPLTNCQVGPPPALFSCILPNKGVLALDNVHLNAAVFAPNGTELVRATAGPVNVPPGGTALLTFNVPTNTTLGKDLSVLFTLPAYAGKVRQFLASAESFSTVNPSSENATSVYDGVKNFTSVIASARNLTMAIDNIESLKSVRVDASFSINLGGLIPLSLSVNADVPLPASNSTAEAQG